MDGAIALECADDAGAVEPGKPAEAVRLVVRVVGADGWFPVFGLAELSPQFAGRAISTRGSGGRCHSAEGRAASDRSRRARGGRSVHDVVRVNIEQPPPPD